MQLAILDSESNEGLLVMEERLWIKLYRLEDSFASAGGKWI
jgi:hypothetical protein